MKDFAKQFYKSTAWIKCRSNYAKSVGGLCERCLQEGRIVPGDIVHHKCYLTPLNIKDPSVTLNYDNLELLCQNCHNKEHFSESATKRYKVMADGKVVIDPPIR